MIIHAIWIAAAVCWAISFGIKREYLSMLGWVCVCVYALCNLVLSYVQQQLG